MRRFLFSLSALAVGCLLPSAAWAQKSHHVVGVGGRYHQLHSAFADYPFGKGDISYGLVYEYHEEMAYWQIGCGYAPSVSGSNGVNYAVTPQINLVFKDNAWRAGIGAARTYFEREREGGDWTDFYWQVLMGVSFPVVRVPLTIMAYYPFDRWSDLDEFDFGDVEFGVWVNFRF